MFQLKVYQQRCLDELAAHFRRIIGYPGISGAALYIKLSSLSSRAVAGGVNSAIPRVGGAV